MLGFKSMKTAAITLAGVELAHRIRKRQFSFGRGRQRGHASLKDLWNRALMQLRPDSLRGYRHFRPRMHQISRRRPRARTKPCEWEPRRYARKIFYGRGLYLLVMPRGGRYWRYNYHFDGKHKTHSLGVHPDISLEKARARHQVARALLAEGTDPSARKRALGKHAYLNRQL